MTIAHDFEYVRSRTLDEAILALSQPGARALAGGTDLIPWLRDDLIEPAVLVDIKAIPGLGGISLGGGELVIGALVTFSEVMDSSSVAAAAPMLIEMAGQVASVGVRNRATIVGNLCSAVPSLDAGPALMVYDALVRVSGPEGDRQVPVEEWFLGPRATRLGHAEVVTGISLRPPATAHGAAFLKLGRYAGEDLAQANLAVLISDDRECRVAFGAVAPRPIRARRIETLLSGSALDEATIEAAAAMVAEEIAPITDIRATAAYRTHMCRVMLRRGLHAAAGRLSGTGPPYPTHLI